MDYDNSTLNVTVGIMCGNINTTIPVPLLHVGELAHMMAE